MLDNKIMELMSTDQDDLEEMQHPTTTPADRSAHIKEMIMQGYTDQQILQIHSEISQADITAAKQELLDLNNETASQTQPPIS